MATKTNEKKEESLATSESIKGLLTTKEVKELESLQDIEARFTKAGGRVFNITEVQPDFALVDAEELINIPFTVAHFEIRKSDDFARFDANGMMVPGKYVSVYVLTDDNKRLVFNDGGTGILPVAENFISVTNQTGGMRCPWGLRASRYETVVNGQKVKATTMYFATSKPKQTT